jgi:hypothetical protein
MHPEQLQDEIFMGNATREDVLKSSWRSSRLGNVAYDINGNVVSGLFPWFIKREEAEQEIRTERLMDKPWSKRKIGVYENMLADKGGLL